VLAEIMLQIIDPDTASITAQADTNILKHFTKTSLVPENRQEREKEKLQFNIQIQ
jgi:hypothetical protein